jgi:putative tricarboxylic transport membrane protein
MKLDSLDRKDVWAGIVLIVSGAAAVFIARDYPFGTLLRMGPGFFPTVLGGLLVLFGIHVLAKGLRDQGVRPLASDDRVELQAGREGSDPFEAGWSPRAMIVLPLSLVLFGVLIDRAGLIPALAALIAGSAAAGKQFKLGEVVLLSAFLIAFSVAVFVWGLGRPYTLVVGF